MTFFLLLFGVALLGVRTGVALRRERQLGWSESLLVAACDAAVAWYLAHLL